jgi:hypothetical protein
MQKLIFDNQKHLYLMKQFFIICSFLFFIINVNGNPRISEQHVSSDDNLTIRDTISLTQSSDSMQALSERDSLQKNYSIILYHLRSENERLQLSLIRNRRIIAALFVIMVILCFAIIMLISKKTLFTSFPHYRQKKGYQPGIVCLQMMHKYYYRKRISYKNIIRNSPMEHSPDYLSIENLAVMSDSLGFEIRVLKVDLSELYQALDLPILLYMPNHMSVLYAIKNDMFYISDPFYGYLKLHPFYFAASWFIDDKNLKGIAIQLYPLKNVKNSVNRRLNLEKFSRLKSWDRKNWKNYGCELKIQEPG